MTTEDRRVTELIRLDALRGEWMVACDVAALDNLFTDDLVHIHASGAMHNKTEVLNHCQHVNQYISIVRSNLMVRFFGPCAIMTGDMVNTFKRRKTGEQRVLNARVTQVWVTTPDGWKMASFQATRVITD